MAVEAKGGILKAVPEEGKAVVRLATLLKVDADRDVIESGFFSSTPLTVSIQPYHNHSHPSLGHAHVREQGQEVLADLEFNDSFAAMEQWKVLRWDYEHGPPIQQFSWAFRVKDGASRDVRGPRGQIPGQSGGWLARR